MPYAWSPVNKAQVADEAAINALGAAVTAHDVALTDAWTTPWVPTLTNLTQGDGTISARCRQIGKTTPFRFKFVLGASSAVGTSPRFTLPFTMPPWYGSGEFVGDVTLIDASTGDKRGGELLVINSTTVEIASYNSTGLITAVTATVPWTWAVNDVLLGKGLFEAL